MVVAKRVSPLPSSRADQSEGALRQRPEELILDLLKRS